MYVGQLAGTPILQVHAMLDSDSERSHFYLCWTNPLRRPAYSSWFNLDINTGTLSLNKTLEESDFASLRELDATVFTAMHSFCQCAPHTRVNQCLDVHPFCIILWLPVQVSALRMIMLIA